jgi:hypothetical protein
VDGEGDEHFLQLLDISRRQYSAQEFEYQNVQQLYDGAWDGFLEGPGWGAWWTQVSHRGVLCLCVAKLTSFGCRTRTDQRWRPCHLWMRLAGTPHSTPWPGGSIPWGMGPSSTPNSTPRTLRMVPSLPLTALFAMQLSLV